METCYDHSGCLRDIQSLKEENDMQWDYIKGVNNKVDSLISKLNAALVGIAMSCILLIIDVLSRSFKF